MLDLKIKDATILDGTGAARRIANVGIRNGIISAVGEFDEPSAETIDASGLFLAPGFIDIHTHFDAQLMWDPYAMPSSLHGFTTVIGGNCGFTVAPMAPQHADYLTRMLSQVEGIPLTTLQAALDLNWRSFGEYLDRFEKSIAVNAGFLVGHSTLRRLVMGEQAVSGNPSPEQVGQMCSLLDASIREGGLGFSSSWNMAHTDGDGNPVPSRNARRAELVALATIVGHHPGTTLEFGPRDSGNFDPEQLDVMTAMSAAADRPINWNDLRVRTADTESIERQLQVSDKAAQRGGAIFALSMPLPSHLQVTLSRPLALDLLPGWAETMHLGLEQRMRAFADPRRRRELEESAKAVAKAPLTTLVKWEHLRFAETFLPENRALEGRTVGEVAHELGKSAFDTFLDVSLSEQLRTYVLIPSDDDDASTWELRRKVWRDPRALIGASDAGAHVDAMCNARYATALIGPVVRERNLLKLEEAVHLISDRPARFYGLRGRGRVEKGYFADLVLFDAATVAPGPIRSRLDFPGGASHLSASAIGIHRVFVNGIEILQDGKPSGAMPGHVLRSSLSIDTVKARY